ncbi:fungal zn(2)-Cys(6) binuclear cluster domain-containing protein [Hirsutella rhossiliensis]|uniref:Fungal zn(2)-Cys(6) binuclear cluster domain-containing protein n=1 Tax=Hirsutella rhossiliensis TaxID=111463 RepID=A0A9P8SNK2_9HYPO|nr:fungal zn(2)-Cys(6) binuclear cluster domain-containing protein [Hirsutella rhossiliensis]KAH0967970.1 fungal zn(2)-Cys(6) binuclear cluster domain-containing protein [Hirsutella rhossiliensis]
MSQIDDDVQFHSRHALASQSSPSPSPSPSRLSNNPSPAQHHRHHGPRKSSSTCATCRARKVRCNGARPRCSNCQRLAFPCSYVDAECSSALPRRRVKQACLSCHGRKARCSGHLPACDRCRAQGLDCVYRPGKQPATVASATSPQSHASLAADSPRPPLDPEPECPLDEPFGALIARTFDLFFRHVHHIPMYSFLHRASLMAQHAAAKVDKPLLLALVGITSCLTDMGPGLRDYGNRCIDDAEALIFADYTRPSTFKVQALVFIIKHRILSNKFASAFVLFAVVSRFAAALRLNYDSPGLCFLAQESRRRLMWSLYCMDSGVSSGHRDFALWRADKIHLTLPCNERNFEFDLPQPAEKLVPDPDEPEPPLPEDVGSLALHVRIFHIRQRILEFSKDTLASRSVTNVHLQSTVLSLDAELDDFANRLPTSFQFSENSLRLRAYSPRICVFVMIHVWWRQCHCDLHRLALAGFRESLPPSRLESLDTSFIRHCQRQCLDHSLAMASIFVAMQRLGVKPVADLDLALCAYQCARMLKYIYLVNADAFGLTAEAVTDQAKVCLRAIEQCCRGPAAAAIASELASWISHGIAAQSPPAQLASPGTFRLNGGPVGHGPARHPVLRSIELSDDPDVVSATRSTFGPTPANRASRLSLPSAAASDALETAAAAAHTGFGDADHLDAQRPRTRSAAADDLPPPELNNAYEGALDGLGLDGGLDLALGLDAASWPSSQEWWAWPEFLNGAGIGGV